MIIVSQDKKDIINFNNIKAISVKENKIIAIGQFIIAEEDGAYILAEYETEKRGIRIVEIDNAYQMCTAAECFEFIRNMYKSPKRQGMTQALLETLAIIAYKQPITKAQIEEIRGVSADHAVNKLLEKNLICETGRLNVPGKPILFGTTNEFLRYFGFKSTNELPPLQEEQNTIIDV